jgi:hypothetical protein
MTIATIKRGLDKMGSRQAITDFERPQICVKSISYRKSRRSVVFLIYLNLLSSWDIARITSTTLSASVF